MGKRQGDTEGLLGDPPPPVTLISLSSYAFFFFLVKDGMNLLSKCCMPAECPCTLEKQNAQTGKGFSDAIPVLTRGHSSCRAAGRRRVSLRGLSLVHTHLAKVILGIPCPGRVGSSTCPHTCPLWVEAMCVMYMSLLGNLIENSCQAGLEHLLWR